MTATRRIAVVTGGSGLCVLGAISTTAAGVGVAMVATTWIAWLAIAIVKERLQPVSALQQLTLFALGGSLSVVALWSAHNDYPQAVVMTILAVTFLASAALLTLQDRAVSR